MTTGGAAGGSANGGTLIIDVQARLDQFEQSLRQMQQQATQGGQAAGNNAGAGVTSGMSKALGALPGLALGAAAAVGAALAAGLKGGFDIASTSRQGIKDLQAQLGLTADEATRVGEVAKKVFGNNWGDDLKGAQEAVSEVRKQLKGLSDEDLQSATESALALAGTFGGEVSEYTSAASALMSKFGLSSKEAFDFVSKGLQDGLNGSGDFLDSIGEYSTQFASGGASAEQFYSVMKSGYQAGVLGTDKASDAFKEFRVRIQDGSKTTGAGLAQLGIDATALGDKMASGQVTAAQAFDLVLGKLRTTTDQNVRMQAGVALIGSQYEDLGNKGSLALDLNTTKTKDLAGATDSIKERTNNLGSVFQTAFRQVQLQLEPLGNLLLDLANDAMPAVQAAIAQLGPIVTNVVKFLVDGFKRGQETVSEFAPQIQGVVGVVRPLLESLGGFFVAAFGLIKQTWETILQPVIVALLPIFKSEFEGIGSVVKAVIDVITGVFNTVTALLKGDWSGAWGFLKDAAIKAFDDLKSAAQSLGPKLQQYGADMGTKLTTGLKSGLLGIKALIFEALASALDYLNQQLPAALQGTLGRVSEASRAAAEQARKEQAAVQAANAPKYGPPVPGYIGAGPRQTDTPRTGPYTGISEYGSEVVRQSLKDTGIRTADEVVDYCAQWVRLTLGKADKRVEGYVNGLFQQDRNGNNKIDANDAAKGFGKAGLLKPYTGTKDLKPGDTVFYEDGGFGHVGIYVGGGFVRGNNRVSNKETGNPVGNVDINRLGTPTSYVSATELSTRVGGAPVTSQPKAGNPVNAGLDASKAPSAEDVRKSVEANIKDILARVDLNILGKDAALKLLARIDAEAVSIAKKTGVGWQEYATTAKTAEGAIASLNKGSSAAKVTKDTLAALGTQFEYVGKTGLPAYVAGLQAFIGQQEKAASAAKKGSAEQLEAQQSVIQARAALKKATESGGEVSASEADLKKYGAQAQVIAQLEEQIGKSTDSAWKLRAQARVAAYNAQGKAAQDVLAVVQSTNATQSQLDKDATERTKVSAANRLSAEQALAAGRLSIAKGSAQAVLSAYDLEVKAAGSDADKRLGVETRLGKDVLAARNVLSVTAAREEIARLAIQRDSDAKAIGLAEQQKIDIKAQASTKIKQVDADLSTTLKGNAQQSARDLAGLQKTVGDNAVAAAGQAISLGVQLAKASATDLDKLAADRNKTEEQAAQSRLDTAIQLSEDLNQIRKDRVAAETAESSYLTAAQGRDAQTRLGSEIQVSEGLNQLRKDNLAAAVAESSDITAGQRRDQQTRLAEEIQVSEGLNQLRKDNIAAAAKESADTTAAQGRDRQTALAAEIQLSEDLLQIKKDNIAAAAKESADTTAGQVRDRQIALAGEIQLSEDLFQIRKDNVAAAIAESTAITEAQARDHQTTLDGEIKLSEQLFQIAKDRVAGEQAIYNSLLEFGGAQVDVNTGDLVFPTEEEIRGIGVAAEDTGQSFVDLGEITKNSLGVTFDELNRLIGVMGLTKEEAETLRGAWVDNQNAMLDATKQDQAAARAELEKNINTFANYAKQVIPGIVAGLQVLGGASEEVAGQWGQDLGSMVGDLVTFGTALAKGDYLGAAIQVFTSIFSFFGAKAKAVREELKKTSDYNNQFKFSTDGYQTRVTESYTTGFLFWQRSHFKEHIDTIKQGLALALEGGFVNGMESGFQKAIEANDFSQFEKTLTQSVGQAVLKGLEEGFINSVAVQEILGPRIKAVLDAKSPEEKAAAQAGLKQGISDVTALGKSLYDDVLKPVADAFGLGGNSAAAGSVADLRQQVSALQTKYDNATSNSDRSSYKGEIDKLQARIDTLTGKDTGGSNSGSNLQPITSNTTQATSPPVSSLASVAISQTIDLGPLTTLSAALGTYIPMLAQAAQISVQAAQMQLDAAQQRTNWANSNRQ